MNESGFSGKSEACFQKYRFSCCSRVNGRPKQIRTLQFSSENVRGPEPIHQKAPRRSLQSLLLFLSVHTHGSLHTRTSYFLNPADPSTLMCVTQGGDSQRWCCRHKGTQAVSIVFALLLFLVCVCLFSSVPFEAFCYVTQQVLM